MLNYLDLMGKVALITGASSGIGAATASLFAELGTHVAVGYYSNCEGRRIVPGQLIHADKHGFLAIPPGDEPGLLEATRFMDAKECQTVIVAAHDSVGRSPAEIYDAVDQAGEMFRAAVREKFGRHK